MSKSTWYRKYRPNQLDELVGQKYNVQTLKQASINDRFVHCYIFSGSRGCGKTSTARILANLMTCINPKDGQVCGTCRACQTIRDEVAMDVIELDCASNGNVENIQNLIEAANWSPTELKKKVYIMDECLGRNARINTENGLIRIDDIVRNKKKINVWSYNEKTKKNELKPITGWFKNSGKDVNKIAFESYGAVYASDGHLLFTPSGYKKVKDINIGDLVYRSGKIISHDQEQLIYGSMLGDANVSKNRILKGNIKTNPRIRFVHGWRQKDYLFHKYSMLKDFVSTPPKQSFHIGFKNCPKIETWSFSTKCSSRFLEVYNNFIHNGKKTINIDSLKKLDWMGIAFWFCDDGSVARNENKSNDGYTVNFNTQGFSKKENQILKKWFLSVGLNASIYEQKKNGHNLYWIVLDKESSNFLLEKIYEYVPSCMDFKLNGYIGKSKKYEYKIMDMNVDARSEIFLEKVIEKKKVSFEKVTYDIEVKDNHNYFVSGTLVHNCHMLTGKAVSALLKITEEPPDYLSFIFCTTEPKKILPTILSRSQRLNFKKIPSKDIANRLAYISKQENVKITEEALFEIAKLSRGCLRDAIVPLEQISTVAGNNEITGPIIQKYFGLPDRIGIFRIVKAMVEGDISLVMDQVNDMIVASADTESIAYEISEIFRSIMLLKSQNGNTSLIDLPEHEIDQIKKIGESVKMGQLDKLSHLFSTIRKELDYSINERWILESTLIHGTAILRKM